MVKDVDIIENFVEKSMSCFVDLTDDGKKTLKGCLQSVKIDLEKYRNSNNITEACLYGHPRFYEILKELGEMHSKKNQDYATEKFPLSNFKHSGNLMDSLFTNKNKALCSAMAFMAKQIIGVYEYIGKDKIGNFDSFNDKMRDIAIYSILCIILYEEGVNDKT